MLLAILRAILTWLAIGAPLVLIYAWDRLVVRWRARRKRRPTLIIVVTRRRPEAVSAEDWRELPRQWP